MDYIAAAIFFSVLKAALCFNIDPVAWKFLKFPDAAFGYQVVQRKQSTGADLLVSAPIAQYSTSSRGGIFKCSTTSCSQLPVALPDYAVNASLGLTMAVSPDSQNILACAPTIPKDCVSITMYNGVCVEITKDNRLGRPLPSSPEECRIKADIAFLLDGSGSVYYQDFSTMKTFVKNMIASFKGKDTQFSITQFSSRIYTHYHFNGFDSQNWENQIDNIQQLKGGTYTAGAIMSVVDYVFVPNRGSRENAKKVLIVITDGESNDGLNLPAALKAAKDKGIVRFAVGVGSAFDRPSARQELRTIATDPPQDHMFQVKNFDALEIIKQKLQEKIFSIEGSQTSGNSLEMEMSQMGFSAAYVTGGFQMGMVGANQWKGGFKRFQRGGVEQLSFEPTTEAMDPDSYLGYSMVVASTQQSQVTIIGAPRYQHRGMVMAVRRKDAFQMIHPYPRQIGQYFGAELCAIDVDHDRYTDLIIISAPMYVESDREGRVYICRLSALSVDCGLENPLILRGAKSAQGRFGSSLAVLPDLNRDHLADLAIGAPLENDGQGSIYIFHGESGNRIRPTYSQRIAGSEVLPGLRFFGISISRTSFDLSGDNQPDLAVGSMGKVLLLRSKPIVMVEAKVTYSPDQISTQNSDCSISLQNKAEVCFIMTQQSSVSTARARITFNLTLDSTRKVPNNRAFINEKKQNLGTKSVELELQRKKCIAVDFQVEACPEDSLNSVNNELKFTFEGLPYLNLSPSLAPQTRSTTIHPLYFEINCGTDNQCVDNLKVDFNFTRSSEVNVGIDELLNVTVSVENSEENAYNSYVILTYPIGLSYRKETILNGRVQCQSMDSNGINRGETKCTINNPIFKNNAKVLFIVSYGIQSNVQLYRNISITANASSANQEHSTLSKLYKEKWINVKYSIFVSVESTRSYNNFTFGKDDLQKPVQQSIEVTNDIRALNFTLVIKVPVKLGDKSIWVDSNNLQFPDCKRDNDEEPTVKDFVAQIKKNKRVDCSVAKCRVFKCRTLMGIRERKKYSISSNLTSGWIQQIGLKSAKFLLTSTASLEYDKDQYIFFSTGLSNNPPIHMITAEVEVYPVQNFTKEIIGGSLGGLALLILLTAVLYKVGFFKSKYKNMIEEGGQDGPELTEPEPNPAE